MELERLVASKRFNDSMRKVASLRRRIQKAAEPQLDRLEKEKDRFFDRMEKDDPELYPLFQGTRKELSEDIIEKRTGVRVRID